MEIVDRSGDKSLESATREAVRGLFSEGRRLSLGTMHANIVLIGDSCSLKMNENVPYTLDVNQLTELAMLLTEAREVIMRRRRS